MRSEHSGIAYPGVHAKHALFLDPQICSNENDRTWVGHTLNQAKYLGPWPADRELQTEN